MSWEVVWEEDALDDLRRLRRGNPRQAERVARAVALLAETGYGDVRPLRAQGWPRAHRLRVGDWRVLFERDEPNPTMTIRGVLPRGRAYRRR